MPHDEDSSIPWESVGVFPARIPVLSSNKGNKLLGRLGWHGQCSCCNGPKPRKSVRAEEKLAWRRAELLVVSSTS